MGMLTLNILLSFAQFERGMTAERVYDKLEQRAKRGKWNGGPGPLGYGYDKISQELKPDPKEAPILVKMFEHTVKFRNATKVAQNINDAGYRTRIRVWRNADGTTRTVGGKRFNHTTVRNIITNPIYKGIIVHNRVNYPGNHSPLVSEKLWQDANDALGSAKPQNGLNNRDKHLSLLKGLVKCHHCGKFFTPTPSSKKDQNGKPYLSYVCTSVVHEKGASSCPLRRLPGRALDSIIIAYLGELGKHPKIIEHAMSAAHDAKSKSLRPLKSQLADVERKLRSVTKEVRNCIEAVKRRGTGSLSQEFLDEGERLSKEKQSLEMQKVTLTADIGYREKAVADKEIMAKTLVRFSEVVTVLPPEEQKELIRLIVREIVVRPYDPNSDVKAAEKGIFRTRIRTKWILVNVSIYASDLLPNTYNIEEFSADLKKNGSRGRARTYNHTVNSRVLYH